MRAGLLYRAAAAAALMTYGARATPGRAEVVEVSDRGFTVSSTQAVSAPSSAVWAALVAPHRWWSSAHSWSGDAAHFSLDPQAGGCFCERWSGGSAQHAVVVQATPAKLLRLRGALGPLQAEALVGTLSISLSETDGRTTIRFDYVVGGHARFAMKDVAPAVDGVIGEQAKRLAALFKSAG